MGEYQEEKAPPLTIVVNFRDVASLVKNLKPGLLYRSANLDLIASTSILGLQLHYIGLGGPQYGLYVASQLGLWDKAKAFAEIAFMPESGVKNYRKLVNVKMCKERMAIPEAIIDHSFPQIKAIFKILVDPSSYPVLIFNKYGTDFVSLIMSLILFALHTDAASIHHDYMQTYEELADLKQKRLDDNRVLEISNDSLVEPLCFALLDKGVGYTLVQE